MSKAVIGYIRFHIHHLHLYTITKILFEQDALRKYLYFIRMTLSSDYTLLRFAFLQNIICYSSIYILNSFVERKYHIHFI